MLIFTVKRHYIDNGGDEAGDEKEPEIIDPDGDMELESDADIPHPGPAPALPRPPKRIRVMSKAQQKIRDEGAKVIVNNCSYGEMKKVNVEKKRLK